MDNFFDAFDQVKYKRRESSVKRDLFAEDADLKEFFKDFLNEDGILEWPVQSLTLDEIGQITREVSEAPSVSNMFASLAKAAMQGDTQELNKAVSDLTGIKENTPRNIIRSYATFEMGTMEPFKPKSRQNTVTLANRDPVFFQNIVDEINIISNLGQTVKKKPKINMNISKEA